MAEKTKKVYDYNPDAVRDRLVTAFRRGNGEATAADLAGLTGLPLAQIAAELPAVSDEYGARLKVAESGEILYSFPSGMKSRYRGWRHTLSRAWKTAKKGLVAAGKTAFKVWTMVMLVGYFVLFLALALFAMVASVAVQRGGGSGDRGDRRGGGGLGGLWMTTRLLDTMVRIWFYSELFKGPADRFRRQGERGPRRPLYKAIFSHVFGDGDPNPSWAETEKKAVVAFLQSHRGIITLPEFMAVTGLSPVEAEAAINRYMLEFEGSPEVSEGGAIYYFFPKLLARVGTTPEAYGSTVLLKRTAKFSSNVPKVDRTFRAINLVNVAFGGYFLYNAATIGMNFYQVTAKGYALRGGLSFLYSSTGYLFSQIVGIADPVTFITWVLGVSPLAFSVFFFSIPVVRSILMERSNEKLKRENLRRVVYRGIIDSPEAFRPETVSGQVDEANPKDPQVPAKITEELAAWSGADPGAAGWNFAELARTQEEAKRARSDLDVSKFLPGGTVFDSQAPVQ